MRSLVFLCLLLCVGLCFAGTSVHPRGCIYALGKCIRECEVGTHAYATGCSQKIPESTCEEPNPKKEEAIICDYSACYCDAPTVRDTVSNKCVALEDCPK